MAIERRLGELDHHAHRIPDLALLTPDRFHIDRNEYFEGAPKSGDALLVSLNLVGQQTRATGRVAHFAYDALGRKTAERWYDNHSTLTNTITTHYDILDRQHSVTETSSTSGLVAAGGVPADEAAFLAAGEPTWNGLNRCRERDECLEKLMRLGIVKK